MNKKHIETFLVIVLLSLIVFTAIHIGAGIKTSLEEFQKKTNAQYEEYLPTEPVPAGPVKLNP